jgi:hypothetical protein
MIKILTMKNITPSKKFLYLLVAIMKHDCIKFGPNVNMSYTFQRRGDTFSPEDDLLKQSSYNTAHISMVLRGLQTAGECAVVEESAYHELTHVQSTLFC